MVWDVSEVTGTHGDTRGGGSLGRGSPGGGRSGMSQEQQGAQCSGSEGQTCQQGSLWQWRNLLQSAYKTPWEENEKGGNRCKPYT